LRALAISLSTLNLSGGVIQIVVPLLVLKRLGMGQDMVGYVFGLSGAFGVVSAFVCGRLRTGRSRAPADHPARDLFHRNDRHSALARRAAPIVACMAISGLANGPLDIALFTLRQRRTDPAWMGRPSRSR